MNRHPLSIIHHPSSDRKRGTYLLWMEVRTAVFIPFGRFQGGEKVDVPAGHCLYAGSAMGGMASRLLRHACRADLSRPHPILPVLERHFGKTASSSPKKMHWHIDYLLEQTAVSFTRAHLLYSSHRWESALAEFLQNSPICTPLADGLGATDGRGTHFFHTTAHDWSFLNAWNSLNDGLSVKLSG